MSKIDYETQQMLDEYLLFHYGKTEEILPYTFGPVNALGFPARSVNELLDIQRLPEQARAFDLGCAVGRASFELTRYCDEVIGADYSEAFITAAQTLQKEGKLDYTKKITGAITEPATATVPEAIDRSKARFMVGDAHNVPESLGCFDVVLAANLLCRMAEPKKLLARLPSLIKPGGQLLLTTPNTWLESVTSQENWLGATSETGDPFEFIKTILEPDFNCVVVKDLPFLIREHVRKFQWSVAQGSLWLRV